MDRGDIYVLSRETDDDQDPTESRSVLIVTPARFNRVTRVPIVLPIASAETATRTAGFAVLLDGTGAATSGVIRCDQPRALDLTIGQSHRVERAPLQVIDEVMAKLTAIMNL